MEIVFDRLIKLQNLDRQIQKASLFLQDIPSKIVSIDQKIKESERIVEEARENLSQNQKKRREVEGHVQDLKERLNKYKSQLSNVRTNLEYSSLLKEIDSVEKKIEVSEEEIISEMLTADDLEGEIHKAQQSAEIAKDTLSKEKDQISSEQKKEETEKNKLEKEKEELIPLIPAAQVKLYAKLANKLDGIGMSPVTEEFCSLCFMRVRPQVLNELREEKEVILCENCGRILYIERENESENR
ncbi:zinc ribbon domain-containing protein [Acidobacteriota bacterium]